MPPQLFVCALACLTIAMLPKHLFAAATTTVAFARRTSGVTVSRATQPWTGNIACSVRFDACTRRFVGRPYVWVANIVGSKGVVWSNTVGYDLPVRSLNVAWGGTVVRRRGQC